MCAAGQWKLLAASGPMPRKPNISLTRKYTVDYTFERSQYVKFELCEYTEDSDATPECPEEGDASPLQQPVLARAVFKLDELIGAFGLRVQIPLIATMSKFESIGSLIVMGKLAPKSQPITLQFSAHHLPHHIFDESGFYFQIYRVETNDERKLLYQSEVIPRTSHPKWNSFCLQRHAIADNRNRLLEVVSMYRDEVGVCGTVGKFLTSYAKLKYGAGAENVYNVINSKKSEKKGYVNSGTFQLTQFTDVRYYSFLDYIISGTQLHFVTAVDFSQPNQNPFCTIIEDKLELMSEIENSVRAIGRIVRDYSDSKLFPAFGFGASVPDQKAKSTHFNLNLNGATPLCRGLDGIINACSEAGVKVIPDYKANFAPIVNTVVEITKSAGMRGMHYFVLTIFTRGAIADVEETIKSLEVASTFPLSIIIVGIGDSNCDQLNRLVIKSDNDQMKMNGHKENETNVAPVKLVELSKLKQEEDTAEQFRARISEEALHQVPPQMTSWMRRHNIAARPPILVIQPPGQANIYGKRRSLDNQFDRVNLKAAGFRRTSLTTTTGFGKIRPSSECAMK
uniref:Copine C-terminal domain-containing protein n=1 Tax=Plectus sambesii TaxID=2011161 RepID=A0A914V9Y5_9BILA